MNDLAYSMSSLREFIGRDLGVSAWTAVTQKMIDDFAYTGEPIRRFRKAGLFTSATGFTRIFKNEKQTKTVSTDAVFQAVLCLKKPLDPTHCLLVLLWIGALKIDGQIPQTPEDIAPLLNAKTRAERLRACDLDLGEESKTPGIYTMQTLFENLYLSWALAAPLSVDA